MRIPFLGLIYFACSCLVALGAFSVYGIDLPDYLAFWVPERGITAAVLLLLLGHGALACALGLLVVRRGTTGRTVALALAVGLYDVYSALEVVYYSKFHSYPNVLVAQDLLRSPRILLEYAVAGLTRLDLGIVVAAVAAMLLLQAFALRDLRRFLAGGGRVPACLTLGVVLIALGATLLTYGKTPDRYVVREHSLSVVHWYVSSPTSRPDNDLNLLGLHLPVPVQRSGPPAGEGGGGRPRHTLLVILECVRADHTPFHGYRRNTFPTIQAHREEWLAIDRVYAHGPSTINSIPVLFKSRYFAGQTRSEQGYPSIAAHLKRAGLETSYFSAASLDWRELDRAVGVEFFDEVFHASMATPEQRRGTNAQGTYFSVDDSVAIEKYAGFLGRPRPADRSTFSVVHFMGSHFPYKVGPPFRKFSPDLGQLPLGATQQQTDAALANTYDNSLLQQDANVARLLALLSERQLLEDSLVIVTADHGEAFGEHHTRFHTSSLYDEQVRVPLLVRVGRRLRGLAGRLPRSPRRPRGLIDIGPTVLDAQGLALPAAMQGTSLLDGREKPYEVLIHRDAGQNVAIVRGRRKYLFDLDLLRAAAFDLDRDPAESRNLWTEKTASLADFLRSLQAAGVLARTDEKAAETPRSGPAPAPP